MQVETYLISQCRLGSESAKAELYNRYISFVRVRANRIVRSADKAEEAANDVFIKLFDILERGMEIDNLPAWLSTTTRNRCIDRLRRRKAPLALISRDTIVSTHYSEKLDSEYIFGVFEEFKGNERKVLELRFIEEWSCKDVQEHLELNGATVRSIIRRGREKLKVKLAKLGYDELR